MIGTTGTHLLVELWGCSPSCLDDVPFVRSTFEEAAKRADTHIVQSVFHRFSPTGVSGVCVVEESHLSVHTWPEEEYAAVDVYTCGTRARPHQAIAWIQNQFRAKKISVLEVKRGEESWNARILQ